MADDPTGTSPDGDPNGPAAPDPTTTPPGNGPDDGTPSDTAPTGTGTADPSGDAPAGDDPDGDAGSARSASRQAAKYRTRAKEAEAERDRLAAEYAEAKKAAEERDELKKRFEDLAKVLNPDAAPDTPPDPEELAKQLEEERKARESETAGYQRQIRELTVQNALPGAFKDAEADPALTLAVLKAEGTLAKLDPTSDTFADDVNAAVAAAVEANPRLKVTREGPRRSGTEPIGPTGGSEQLTLEQYKRLTPEEAVKAQKEGRLRKLLGG